MSASRGLAIQKIEGLFAADSIFEFYRAPPSRVKRARIASVVCFDCLCERFHFAFNFLVADLDFFLLGNLVEQ